MPDAIALIIGGPDIEDHELFWSDTGFTSNATDSLYPSRNFHGVIIGEVEVNTQVSCVFWGRRSGFNISQIELINNDGALDYLLDAAIKGKAIQIRTGDTSVRWDDWNLEYAGVVEDLSFANANRPRLIIANSSARFEVAFQPNVYPDTANDAIAGSPIPKAMGLCYNVPCLLTDPVALTYETGAGTGTTVLLVRDNGAELTPTTQWTQSNGVITLLDQPAGRITADIDTGSQDVASFAEIIMASAGLSSGDLGDLGGIDAEGYTLGYWSGGTPVTCEQVMNTLVDAYAGWWWMDKESKVRFGQLKEPSVSADFTITPNDFDKEQVISANQDGMPGFSRICAGKRNFHVSTPSEIATALTSPTVTQISVDLQKDYRFRGIGETAGSPSADQSAETEKFEGARVTTGGTGIGTMLQVELEIKAEADRWTALRDVRRRFFELPLVIANAREIEIGDTIKVTAPSGRHGPRVGLNETNLLVIGVKYKLRAKVAIIRAWG
jgi:hypothetical protein